jgi:phosphatidylserine/phosphatidylglycerophosphate/cardiolipin synthase-like enzyme
MPASAGPVVLFMGPHTLGGPDDLGAAIINFINGAQRELLIAVQEIDHPDIAAALIAARRRGVRVFAVVEQDYLREPKALDDGEAGSLDANRAILSSLLRVGGDVKADYNPDIFHQKYIVRDGSTVLTGSTNFTETDVGRNLNHLAIIDDPRVAAEYTREFKQIRDGIFGKRSLNVPRRPIEPHPGGVLRVKPLFAPDHAPEMEFIKQMIKAQSRIDFATFTFAQSSGIDDALVNARQKGLSVQGVLDRKQANQIWAAKETLVSGGVVLHQNRSGSGVRKVHHKLMVIDDALTIIGSFNYTAPANLVNDENIVVLGDLDATDPAERDAQVLLAAFARAEIDRIIANLAEPILP